MDQPNPSSSATISYGDHIQLMFDKDPEKIRYLSVEGGDHHVVIDPSPRKLLFVDGTRRSPINHGDVVKLQSTGAGTVSKWLHAKNPGRGDRKARWNGTTEVMDGYRYYIRKVGGDTSKPIQAGDRVELASVDHGGYYLSRIRSGDWKHFTLSNDRDAGAQANQQFVVQRFG